MGKFNIKYEYWSNSASIRFFFLLIVTIIIDSGCKKFIEVDAPITSVNGGNVYTTDDNAIAAVTGIFASMANSDFTLNMSVFPDLSSDNFNIIDLTNTNFAVYYQNSLISNYDPGTIQFWTILYSYIFKVNDAIEGLNKSSALSPSIKQRLLGEVYFLRAFYYFYLINYYGDVPLALTTDYIKNNNLLRNSSSDVYQQIISDLLLSKGKLDDQYLDGSLTKVTTERIRPNRMAVNALLTKAYLSEKNYAAANSVASEVIDQTALYSSSIPLNEVFLKNSMETIWALQPVKSNFNTDEANFYVLQSGGPDANRPIYFSSDFLNSFEDTDLRKVACIDSITKDSQTYYYPAKYKVVYGSETINEYPIVLRLSEQYLLRAEARANLNDITGSQADLNIIRNRAGLSNTNASSTASLITAILKEGRAEFFTEWGNRWLNLKRSGLVNSVMQIVMPLKGGTWQTYKGLYPIPLTEIQSNGNLVQNPGYN